MIALCHGITSPLAAERPSSGCPDCNVLVISIDTLRADHLGCYGYPKPTSPNIDRFRKESVLFRTAIAHAPSTEPSHASIFTSMIPAHHGALRAKRMPISKNVVTMAEILRSAGYRTVSFNGGGQVGASYGFDRGFEVYESSTGRFSEKVGAAIDWLERNAEGKFFLFLHTYEVHAPYEPTADYLRLFETEYSGTLPDRITPGLLIKINAGAVDLDGRDVRHIVNTYDAQIRSMDDAFGKLITHLRSTRLLDRTLIVFTSDHGEEFGEHGQLGRHSHALYDELLRVPLIVRMPGARSASTVVERQVRGIDILPTVVDVLDLQSLAQFEGSTLTGLMAQRQESERVAVSQLDTTDELPPSSIRTESRKLIVGPHSFVQQEVGYQWFKDRVEIVSDAQHLMLPMESFHVPRTVKISANGEFVRRAVIPPRKQILSVPFRTSETRTVTIESATPCTSTEEVGADLDLPCASFRVFNPFEYFRLDDDPGEQHNLFADAAHRKEIAALQQQLDAALSGAPAAGEAPVEVDERTRERLKSLGYVD